MIKLPNFAICSANIVKYRIMENKQELFLDDMLGRLQSLKEQIAQLETLVTEYIAEQKVSDSQKTAEQIEGDLAIEENLPEEEPEKMSDDLPDLPENDVPQRIEKPEPQAEPTLLDEEEDLPEDDVPSAMPSEAETKKDSASETVDIKSETVDIKIDDDFEVLPLGEAIAPAKDAVMDKMAEKESWRTDMPGSGVNDIRSAISLNDRILFINTLFHEDPIAFKDTLGKLNSMQSFEDGVKYLKNQHPEWNTESEVVYRFMMAVRRKLK
mgnify:CR=1 FL=1